LKKTRKDRKTNLSEETALRAMSNPYWMVNGWKLCVTKEFTFEVRDPDFRVIKVFNRAVDAEHWAASHDDHASRKKHISCGSVGGHRKMGNTNLK